MNAFVSAFGLVKGAFTSAFGPSAAAAGTYEVTVQPIENYSYYDVGDDSPRYYLLVSKTAAKRWLIEIDTLGSAGADVFSSEYTNAISVPITPGMTATQIATTLYASIIASTDLSVTRDGATLTFTASQTGNLTDSVGFPTPTITQGS
jgi:hypothetical protein